MKHLDTKLLIFSTMLIVLCSKGVFATLLALSLLFILQAINYKFKLVTNKYIKVFLMSLASIPIVIFNPSPIIAIQSILIFLLIQNGTISENKTYNNFISQVTLYTACLLAPTLYFSWSKLTFALLFGVNSAFRMQNEISCTATRTEWLYTILNVFALTTIITLPLFFPYLTPFIPFTITLTSQLKIASAAVFMVSGYFLVTNYPPPREANDTQNREQQHTGYSLVTNYPPPLEANDTQTGERPFEAFTGEGRKLGEGSVSVIKQSQ